MRCRVCGKNVYGARGTCPNCMSRLPLRRRGAVRKEPMSVKTFTPPKGAKAVHGGLR